MANKAAKQQASRNRERLKNMHITSALAHAIFLISRLTMRRGSTTSSSWILYALLSAPALGVEFWFQQVGSPTYKDDGELRSAGEDLEAQGLTYHLWDFFYASIAVLGLAAVFGDKLWWLWSLIPAYGIYLAITTYQGVRKGFSGMTGQDAGNGQVELSNRQRKREARGGQRIAVEQ